MTKPGPYAAYPSYPSSAPSLPPVASSIRPPLRRAAPQRSSGLLFLLAIAVLVGGAGIAGMTFVPLEAKHTVATSAPASATPAAPLPESSSSASAAGFGVPVTVSATLPEDKSLAAVVAAAPDAGALDTAIPSVSATEPAAAGSAAVSDKDKNKQKKRARAKAASSGPSPSSTPGGALPDTRMPTRLPDNPYAEQR
jgi:hypothetical protein